MPKNTAQRRIDSRRQNRSTTISGVTLSAPAGVSDHGALSGLADDDHSQYLLADGSRSLAGNLAVGAGITIDGIDLSAHAADPAAHHALATAGNSGISVAGQAISLAAAAAGAGLGYASGVLSVNVAGLGLSVASDAVTLTSSSNPGAAAAILASDSSGYLNLVRLVLSDRLRSPLIDTASGNLTIQPAGDIVVDPVGNDVLPATNYDINLGALSKKYLTLHAAELWVETLVAQNTIATIGGRILVGPTTYLSRDMGTGDTTIYVRHNQMVSGDRAYMEADGKVEFFAITSGPTTISATEFSYTVTRNLDGTGANAWYAGDAMFNTGQAGNGFIDLYSLRGVKTASQAGPTIVGNVRNSSTFNDWSEAWAIGNLNGLYGYGANTVGVGLGKYASGQPNIVIDPTNGVRLRQYTTDMIVLDPSGNSYFAGVMTIGTAGEIRQGTGTLGSNYTGLRIWRDSSIGRIGGYASNVLQWYGDTDGKLYAGGGNVILSSSGIRILGSTYAWTTSPPATEISWARTGFSSSPLVSIGAGTLETSKEGLQVTLFNYGGTASNSLVKFKFRDSAGVFLSDVDIYRNDIYVDNNKVWHQGNDGSGSGLDADTLDTYQAASFALLSGATFTGHVVTSNAYLGVNGANGGIYLSDRDGGGEQYYMFHNGNIMSWWNSTAGDTMQLTYTGELRVGNTSDLYSAKIQTNGNIHAQGAVTSEIYLQMKSASTPAAATGFARMWFDGTNIKVILPGGTTRTLNWT